MIGFSKTYHNARILESSGGFERFARGFNKTYPLFEIVDAGNEKECADDKIRSKSQHQISVSFQDLLLVDVFDMHINDVHCRHILFGGPTDTGYVRQLVPHSVDEQACKRITLLEGPNFEKGYSDLVRRIRTHRFNSVFRTEKLEVVSRKVSFSSTSPKSPVSVIGPPAPALKRPETPSYASTVVAGSSSGFRVLSIVSPPAVSQNGVLRNTHGQRIDPPLKYSSTLVSELKPRKLCNRFHILGECPYEPCNHKHGAKLGGDQLNALRRIARQTPCTQGSECDDEKCLLGHSCPATPCTWGQECKFPREMHGIDNIVTN